MGVPGKRVLVVDDDLSIAEGVAAVLGIRGYQAAHVQTTAAAIASITAERPDAIVLDVVLSEDDGLFLYRDLRAWWPEIPIVLTTGYVDVSNLPAESAKLRILRKPFDSDALITAMNAMGV